jgi:hypothetical protein
MMATLRFMYQDAMCRIRQEDNRHTHRCRAVGTEEPWNSSPFSPPSNKSTSHGESYLSVSGVNA